jgi:hypothetical protein
MISIGWPAGMNEMQRLRAKCFDAKGDASGVLGALGKVLPPTAAAEVLDRAAQDIHKERLKDEEERR